MSYINKQSFSYFGLYLLFVTALFGLSCQHNSQGSLDRSSQSVVQIGDLKFQFETVASNLVIPWALAFTNDGRLIFTERTGRLRVVENGKLRAEPLFIVSDVVTAGESGLMGLALHPNFSQNHLLYLSYTYGNDAGRVRVVRYRETGSGLVDRKVIIEDIPAAQFHAGCRIRFGPDSKLYITTGDATKRELAQQLDSLAGKLLRVNDDGTIPPDNPFIGRAGVRPEIYSYGHRNSQGFDWQPGTNLLFETEHGPSGFDGPGGGDEVNIIEAGQNYGWPIVHHRQEQSGMISPILEYTPAVAPAGATFYRGNKYPAIKGNYFFACLRGETIIRVVLNGRRVVRNERLLAGEFGRIRDVVEGPDGALYFSTSNHGRNATANDDRIIRMVPVE
jgi:aldose sugar dehydrogenase